MLERTKMKVEKTEEDHARHNSGGARRGVIAATSLDDESS
jgi:hypothetical protein